MSPPRLGLRENFPQFTLLVVLNGFVGAMVGLERTVLPLLGEQEFGLASKTGITSFIVSFGVTKAVLNLVAARLSDWLLAGSGQIICSRERTNHVLPTDLRAFLDKR